MVAAGGAAFAMTKKVTDSFDNIAKTSTKMGVSTDAYQEMEYWASQNGIATNQMEKALGRLNQRMGRAADGNEKYSDALTNLGVDMDKVRDGTISTEDAFAQSIKTLSEMSSESEKSAAASELFGTKMSRDLMPALQDGSLSLEDAKEKAHELGLVIEEDTLNAAEDFNDTWDDMTRMMGAFGQKIIAEMMPIFQSFMEWIMENMPLIQAVFETAFEVIGTVFGTVIELVQTLISWISTLFESSEETMTGIWEVISETFDAIIEFLSEAWEFISELWNEHGESILDTATSIFTQVYEVVEFAFNTVWDVVQEILELVVPYVQEMLEKLFEFWDKHGENIMKIVKFAFGFVKTTISTIMPVISGIVEGAWGVISAIFTTATNVIMGIIGTFSSLLTGDWEGLWNGLKDTTLSVLESLGTLIKAPINGIIAIINGMIGGLNKISIPIPKIPDWIPGIGGKGGGDIGFNIPEIPSLATGGVVHDPTLAMIGDAGAGNPEIVTPEKMLRGIFNESLENSKAPENHNYADMFRGMFSGAEFVIRNENDIKKLARQLAEYIEGRKKARGIRT